MQLDVHHHQGVWFWWWKVGVVEMSHRTFQVRGIGVAVLIGGRIGSSANFIWYQGFHQIELVCNHLTSTSWVTCTHPSLPQFQRYKLYCLISWCSPSLPQPNSTQALCLSGVPGPLSGVPGPLPEWSPRLLGLTSLFTALYISIGVQRMCTKD